MVGFRWSAAVTSFLACPLALVSAVLSSPLLLLTPRAWPPCLFPQPLDPSARDARAPLQRTCLSVTWRIKNFPFTAAFGIKSKLARASRAPLTHPTSATADSPFLWQQDAPERKPHQRQSLSWLPPGFPPPVIYVSCNTILLIDTMQTNWTIFCNRRI